MDPAFRIGQSNTSRPFMDLVFAPSEIETWPIDRLRPYARNAKKHPFHPSLFRVTCGSWDRTG